MLGRKLFFKYKNPDIAYGANPQVFRSCPYARGALWQGKVALQCLLICAGCWLDVDCVQMVNTGGEDQSVCSSFNSSITTASDNCSPRCATAAGNVSTPAESWWYREPAVADAQVASTSGLSQPADSLTFLGVRAWFTGLRLHIPSQHL